MPLRGAGLAKCHLFAEVPPVMGHSGAILRWDAGARSVPVSSPGGLWPPFPPFEGGFGGPGGHVAGAFGGFPSPS